MKFSCTQENLDKALQLVTHIAGKHINLPILQNILIQAEDNRITISATNLEIGVKVVLRAKVDESGEFTVPAQLFANYVHLLQSDRVDCVLDEKEFTVQSTEKNTVIKGDFANDFPILPSITKDMAYVLPKEDFERGLQQALMAASTDDTRPELAGVFFNFIQTDLVLVGTDGHRLVERVLTLQQNATSEHQSCILPQRSAQELLRLVQNTNSEHVSLYLRDDQLGCDVGDVEFVSRLVEGNYPEYKAIIPQASSLEVLVDKGQFIKAIKSAALFSKSGINDIYLQFITNSQNITLTAQNAQLGNHTAQLPFSGAGEDVDIVFNYRYLLDVLQQIDAVNVRLQLTNGANAVIFTPDDDTKLLCLVMPITQ